MALFEEGDKCPFEDCDGTLQLLPVENCSCHISPPCNACVDNVPVCNKCGWSVEDELP